MKSAEESGKTNEVAESMFLEWKAQTADQREQERQRTDKFIEVSRRISREKYIEMNASNLNKLGLEESSIIFFSRYSPMTIVELQTNEIVAAAETSVVTFIDFYEELQGEDMSLATTIQSVEANYVRDTLGFDGYGVRIGQHEKYFASNTDSATVGKVTHVGSGSLPPSGDLHPLNMARSILTIAPNSRIWSVSNTGNTVTSFYKKIESLIDNGVYVINISWGAIRDADETNWYKSAEIWLDHICNAHDISVIQAAGNAGETTGNICVPGLAYNVVTVGAVDDKNTGTNYSDDVIRASSSTKNGNTIGCAKPDLMATDANNGGTSSATAVVTGVVAQMMECRSALKTNPRAVKAILAASCTRKVPGESIYNGLTACQGAGVINARKAIWILSAGRFTTGTLTASELSKTFSVTSSDNVISVSSVWFRANTVPSGSSHTSGTINTGTYIDLNLFVYKPNGSLQKSSSVITSAAEKVYFDVTTTGIYTIKLKKANTSDPNAKYGLAWY